MADGGARERCRAPRAPSRPKSIRQELRSIPTRPEQRNISAQEIKDTYQFGINKEAYQFEEEQRISTRPGQRSISIQDQQRSIPNCDNQFRYKQGRIREEQRNILIREKQRSIPTRNDQKGIPNALFSPKNLKYQIQKHHYHTLPHSLKKHLKIQNPNYHNFFSPNTHRPLPPMPRPASHPAAGPRRVPLLSFCLAIHARSRLARRAAASRCTRRGRPLPEGCWSTTFPPSCPSTLSQAGPRFPSGTCSHHISPKCYTLALSDSQ
jgi:hypothetical protein